MHHTNPILIILRHTMIVRLHHTDAMFPHQVFIYAYNSKEKEVNYIVGR